MKAHKKLSNKKSGQGSKYTKPWRFNNSMTYIHVLDSIKQRSTISSVTRPDDIAESDDLKDEEGSMDSEGEHADQLELGQEQQGSGAESPGIVTPLEPSVIVAESGSTSVIDRQYFPRN